MLQIILLSLREIWSALPEVFVGQASQLSPLLQLLCHELALMNEAVGRPLPPWRTFHANAGRWLSSACVDLPVPTVAAAVVSAAAASLSAPPLQEIEGVSVAAARKQISSFLGSFQTGGAHGGVGLPIMQRGTRSDMQSGFKSAGAAERVEKEIAECRDVVRRPAINAITITGFDLQNM